MSKELNLSPEQESRLIVNTLAFVRRVKEEREKNENKDRKK